MATQKLDSVDMGILYLLQENARRNTTEDIGDKVGVSSSTVGNRISKLEARGVITGYHPTVDYEQTDLNHHLLLVGTVPFEEQAEVADDVMSVSGVVTVRELLTNRQNVSIELVGHSRADVEESLGDIHSRGVDVERMEMVKRERKQPFDNMGRQFVDEE